MRDVVKVAAEKGERKNSIFPPTKNDEVVGEGVWEDFFWQIEDW